ncbi:proprotein_convertase subtilisin/kexin type 5 isoform X1 [Hexamita inflata]|uniref:Proprotein convertase subtilisin/kexin type 5 isoform X1 n=1 Tax=Hexamita inflata TaxID=28002 RepID=A0AA86NW71_9EUKA|nr:proprotein convertase subtilisin/kexin type 5 isoform X1 [Hexamita inflata]
MLCYTQRSTDQIQRGFGPHLAARRQIAVCFRKLTRITELSGSRAQLIKLRLSEDSKYFITGWAVRFAQRMRLAPVNVTRCFVGMVMSSRVNIEYIVCKLVTSNIEKILKITKVCISKISEPPKDLTQKPRNQVVFTTVCPSKAYEKSGADLLCVSSCSGMFVTNASSQNSKQCITLCPDATPYYETGACVEKCTSGSYSVVTGQTQTLVCQASCVFYVKNASNQDSHQCLSKCPDELPYSDAGLCSERCASGNYSSDSGSFVCQGECLKFFVTNSSNANSKQCITKCPDATPYYETGACVEKCTSGSYSVETGQTQTLVCQASCVFFVLNASNSNSHQCLASCPAATPYSDAGLCSARCVSGNYSSASGSLVCQGACAKVFVTNASNANSKQCVDSCQAGQVTSAQECLSSCPSAAPFNDSTACVARCSSGAYLAAGSNLTCVSSCTEIYITNASNSNSKQCLSSCPDATPYYETGACVVKCSTGAYSVVTGQTQTLLCQASCTFFVLNASSDNSKQCLPSCPGAAPYSDAGLCSARCASGAYSSLSSVLTCQPSCAKFFVVNASNSNSKQCVDACAQGQVSNGQECLGGCPSSAPYKEGSICHAVCPSKAYEKSGADLLCVSSCSGMFVTNASSQNSKQCITLCPDATPLRNRRVRGEVHLWLLFGRNRPDPDSRVPGVLRLLRPERLQFELPPVSPVLPCRGSIFGRRPLFCSLCLWKLLQRLRLFRLPGSLREGLRDQRLQRELEAVRGFLPSRPGDERPGVSFFLSFRRSVQRLHRVRGQVLIGSLSGRRLQPDLRFFVH